MSRLPKQPRAPGGVKYALTVPQSVLFADLSLQGNRRSVFKRSAGIDYEPEYVAIDAGGAMRWNYDDDKELNDALLKGSDTVADAVDSFVRLMERTAGELDDVSKSLASAKIRDSGELLAGLKTYWRAYEDHMTSLFTFWNVEHMLSDTLTAELKSSGRQQEVEDGLARYLIPDKPNYFVKERADLKKLAAKFNVTSSTAHASQPLTNALKAHREKYGFLIEPFNMDNPLSVDDLLERTKEAAAEPIAIREEWSDFSDLDPDLKRLAVLAQRFTFWKNERLDLFALADSRVRRLYRAAAEALSLKPDELFAMTKAEITGSLESGKVVVSNGDIRQRQKAYCLILAEGRIGFCQPSVSSAKSIDDVVQELTGVSASGGVARGKVRLIKSLKDAKDLKKGEIIVTAMTRPEMGAALDRAAAFVTDEGGMLCHAAIISREMKKPCVIATGNATKMLTNGQMVEVDGTKGVVKILGD